MKNDVSFVCKLLVTLENQLSQNPSILDEIREIGCIKCCLNTDGTALEWNTIFRERVTEEQLLDFEDGLLLKEKTKTSKGTVDSTRNESLVQCQCNLESRKSTVVRPNPDVVDAGLEISDLLDREPKHKTLKDSSYAFSAGDWKAECCENNIVRSIEEINNELEGGPSRLYNYHTESFREERNILITDENKTLTNSNDVLEVLLDPKLNNRNNLTTNDIEQDGTIHLQGTCHSQNAEMYDTLVKDAHICAETDSYHDDRSSEVSTVSGCKETNVLPFKSFCSSRINTTHRSRNDEEFIPLISSNKCNNSDVALCQSNGSIQSSVTTTRHTQKENIQISPCDKGFCTGTRKVGNRLTRTYSDPVPWTLKAFKYEPNLGLSEFVQNNTLADNSHLDEKHENTINKSSKSFNSLFYSKHQSRLRTYSDVYHAICSQDEKVMPVVEAKNDTSQTSKNCHKKFYDPDNLCLLGDRNVQSFYDPEYPVLDSSGETVKDSLKRVDGCSQTFDLGKGMHANVLPDNCLYQSHGKSEDSVEEVGSSHEPGSIIYGTEMGTNETKLFTYLDKTTSYSNAPKADVYCENQKHHCTDVSRNSLHKRSPSNTDLRSGTHIETIVKSIIGQLLSTGNHYVSIQTPDNNIDKTSGRNRSYLKVTIPDATDKRWKDAGCQTSVNALEPLKTVECFPSVDNDALPVTSYIKPTDGTSAVILSGNRSCSRQASLLINSEVSSDSQLYNVLSHNICGTNTPITCTGAPETDLRIPKSDPPIKNNNIPKNNTNTLIEEQPPLIRKKDMHPKTISAPIRSSPPSRVSTPRKDPPHRKGVPPIKASPIPKGGALNNPTPVEALSKSQDVEHGVDKKATPPSTKRPVVKGGPKGGPKKGPSNYISKKAQQSKKSDVSIYVPSPPEGLKPPRRLQWQPLLNAPTGSLWESLLADDASLQSSRALFKKAEKPGFHSLTESADIEVLVQCKEKSNLLETGCRDKSGEPYADLGSDFQSPNRASYSTIASIQTGDSSESLSQGISSNETIDENETRTKTSTDKSGIVPKEAPYRTQLSLSNSSNFDALNSLTADALFVPAKIEPDYEELTRLFFQTETEIENSKSKNVNVGQKNKVKMAKILDDKAIQGIEITLSKAKITRNDEGSINGFLEFFKHKYTDNFDQMYPSVAKILLDYWPIKVVAETLESYTLTKEETDGRLSLSEYLFHRCLGIPCIKERLGFFILRIKMVEEVIDMEGKLETLYKSLLVLQKQLAPGGLLRYILALALKMGNYVNKGNKEGSGFKLKSLLAMSNLNTVDGSTNLLRIISKYIFDQRPDCIMHFSLLSCCEEAAKVDLGQVSGGILGAIKSLDTAINDLEKQKGKFVDSREVEDDMRSFAESRIQELRELQEFEGKCNEVGNNIRLNLGLSKAEGSPGLILNDVNDLIKAIKDSDELNRKKEREIQIKKEREDRKKKAKRQSSEDTLLTNFADKAGKEKGLNTARPSLGDYSEAFRPDGSRAVRNSSPTFPADTLSLVSPLDLSTKKGPQNVKKKDQNVEQIDGIEVSAESTSISFDRIDNMLANRSESNVVSRERECINTVTSAPASQTQKPKVTYSDGVIWDGSTEGIDTPIDSTTIVSSVTSTKISATKNTETILEAPPSSEYGLFSPSEKLGKSSKFPPTSLYADPADIDIKICSGFNYSNDLFVFTNRPNNDETSLNISSADRGEFPTHTKHKSKPTVPKLNLNSIHFHCSQENLAAEGNTEKVPKRADKKTNRIMVSSSKFTRGTSESNNGADNRRKKQLTSSHRPSVKIDEIFKTPDDLQDESLIVRCGGGYKMHIEASKSHEHTHQHLAGLRAQIPPTHYSAKPKKNDNATILLKDFHNISNNKKKLKNLSYNENCSSSGTDVPLKELSETCRPHMEYSKPEGYKSIYEQPALGIPGTSKKTEFKIDTSSYPAVSVSTDMINELQPPYQKNIDPNLIFTERRTKEYSNISGSRRSYCNVNTNELAWYSNSNPDIYNPTENSYINSTVKRMTIGDCKNDPYRSPSNQRFNSEKAAFYNTVDPSGFYDGKYMDIPYSSTRIPSSFTTDFLSDQHSDLYHPQFYATTKQSDSPADWEMGTPLGTEIEVPGDHLYSKHSNAEFHPQRIAQSEYTLKK